VWREVDQFYEVNIHGSNLFFSAAQDLDTNDAHGDLLRINLILPLDNAFLDLFDSFRSEFIPFANKLGYSL
jgi:hypothetical protein